jgi:hypothetical protein
MAVKHDIRMKLGYIFVNKYTTLHFLNSTIKYILLNVVLQHSFARHVLFLLHTTRHDTT